MDTGDSNTAQLYLSSFRTTNLFGAYVRWGRAEAQTDNLSNIIKAFNDQFGGLFNDPPGRREAHYRHDTGEGECGQSLPECQAELGPPETPPLADANNLRSHL